MGPPKVWTAYACPSLTRPIVGLGRSPQRLRAVYSCGGTFGVVAGTSPIATMLHYVIHQVDRVSPVVLLRLSPRCRPTLEESCNRV